VAQIAAANDGTSSFDHSTPAPGRDALKDHVVVEAVERGWERLGSGALFDAEEAAGFEIFVTADKNMRYKQNLAGRNIAVIALSPFRGAIV
jgi:hypothetical protein